MTVYQQVQNAIDFIEENLTRRVTCEEVAIKANMSLRNFYNYFWIISGFKYGVYLRRRRLTLALSLLKETKSSILNIALQLGYESHESFTRAFKTEYGLTPLRYRKSRQDLCGTEKIKIIEEMYMGMITKELPEMFMVSYIGFSPDPEEKAHDRIDRWAKEHGYGELYGRNFGHDTDKSGEGYSPGDDMSSYGYKVMISVDPATEVKDSDLTLERFPAGKFVVTGVEGEFERAGEFIPEGWNNLAKMIEEKGYKLKENGRCLEEKLEPSAPNLLRLDLYVEIDR